MQNGQPNLRLQRFDTVADFSVCVEPFLLQQEAVNNLSLGLTRNLMRGVTPAEPPYLAVVYDNQNQIVAAGLRIPPHNLVLPVTDSTDALELLTRDVYEVYESIPGIVGTKENALSVVNTWAQLTGQQAHVETYERIYQLEKVISVTGVPGNARQATMDDYDLLYRWAYEFMIEAIGSAEPTQIARDLESRLKPELGGMYLWEVDGQPVCMVGYTGFTPHGVRVGLVYTPVEHRKHGYASACTAAVSQFLLDTGRRFCFLFTDLSNPISNHIYQTIGYEPVCDIDLYRF
ncbi:MAG TPA: GNAT family N-acetyltransferase [Phototrophicaceae bacterium]|jgi:predicted GNAT family acetyltransferase|nr:GNAT family N-acetyltransferase [Phototrophicaceae bacterium]